MAVAKLRGVVEKVERCVRPVGPHRRYSVILRLRWPYAQMPNSVMYWNLPPSAHPVSFSIADDLIKVQVDAKDEMEAYTLVLGCLEVGEKEPKEQDHAHQG